MPLQNNRPAAPWLRSLALRVPQIARLVAQRDALLAQVQAAQAPPSALGSLCEVVNPARYSDPEWLELHHDLSRYSIDKHCFRNHSQEVYRKGWEWTHCVYGLRKLGMIRPTHRAVGVGAGREAVIWWMADHIRHVTATDLYGEAAWTDQARGREADPALIEESRKHCPASVDLTRVTLENQDGTRLTYPDDSFDFAWSLSSIEHFGGHAAAVKAIQEMGRVVRPGGIVAVATEMLMLNEYRHGEYFTPAEIEAELVPASPELELVAPIDYDTLPREYLIDSVTVPQFVDRRRRHVVLNDGHVQWTSVMLFFRKHPRGTGGE